MNTMNEKFDSSLYFGGNAPFVEEVYENYLNDPTALVPELARFNRQFMLNWQYLVIVTINRLATAKHKIIDRHRIQFGLGIADQFLEVQIRFNDGSSFRVNQNNGFGRFLHQRPVALFTFP